jgi:hypothetical protein
VTTADRTPGTEFGDPFGTLDPVTASVLLRDLTDSTEVTEQ